MRELTNTRLVRTIYVGDSKREMTKCQVLHSAASAAARNALSLALLPGMKQRLYQIYLVLSLGGRLALVVTRLLPKNESVNHHRRP